MKYCTACNAKYDDSISFCSLDGEVLEADPASIVDTVLDGQYQMEALLVKVEWERSIARGIFCWETASRSKCCHRKSGPTPNGCADSDAKVRRPVAFGTRTR